MSHESSTNRRAFLIQIGTLVPAGALGLSAATTEAGKTKASAKSRAKPKSLDAARPDSTNEPTAAGSSDPSKLKLAQFQPLVKQDFSLVAANNKSIPLTLTEARDLRGKNDKTRPSNVRSDPFLLVFVAKNFDKVPAKIYTLSNLNIGTFDVYLNEVRADDDPATVHYAVVFN